MAKTCCKHGASARSVRLLFKRKGVSIVDKIKTVTSKVYGASGVNIPEHVMDKIKMLEANGFGDLPVWIAKTQLSISHDPKMKDAPSNYTFPIVDCNVSAANTEQSD